MNWQEAIKQLDNKMLGSVNLVCDGYNVTYVKEFYKATQLRIMFYIDGTWKGTYSNPESEIGAKFGSPRYFKPDKKNIQIGRLLARIERRRFNEKEFVKDHTRILAYHPTHASAASVIRTLKKTCKNIELIEGSITRLQS